MSIIYVPFLTMLMRQEQGVEISNQAFKSVCVQLFLILLLGTLQIYPIWIIYDKLEKHLFSVTLQSFGSIKSTR